ncbi:nitroreductase family protein [Fructobacillus ficulneus]|uniref:nitroreductase family protein n=1 Tax=Fructobacillus ficulneus TaxID=157463 RepID=UPI00078208FF
MKNEVLNQLHDHQSVRSFTDQPVTDEEVESIFSAAFAGPNMQNFQPVTFIEITDQDLKKRVTEKVHMKYIESATRYFVVAVDWHKVLLNQDAETRKVIENRIEHYQYLEGGIVSASIALGRAQVAAESMGIGSVTMAGAMGAFELYEEELDLPKYVKPIMGFSLGYPAQLPGVRPKLPLEGSIMTDKYDDDQMKAAIRDYDHTMTEYFAGRDIDSNWTKHNADLFNKIPANPALSQYPKDKGFNLK